ncbi:cytochrome P450 [Actinoplanes sp. NPDC051861]|uniref:cytochrome P450 n=1 Tax=Actinoplanes sp. NPDC051861 TaxID=3155170 RepID=UPI0034126B5B
MTPATPKPSHPGEPSSPPAGTGSQEPRSQPADSQEPGSQLAGAVRIPLPAQPERTRPRRMRAARRRDRRVYLLSHPLLFALLAATRHRPSTRLGRTVLTHSRTAFVDGLTRVPLNRTAEGTTGGAAGTLTGGSLLFDQEGDAHRTTRRSLADHLSADGVSRLRPIWLAVLNQHLTPLSTGGTVDLVSLSADLAGTTAAALLNLDVPGPLLATAARTAAAAAARDHLPGLRRPGAHKAAHRAAANLTTLIISTRTELTAEPGESEGDGAGEDGLAAMLAVAAVNTTVAALPRAVAWCADAGLWSYAESHPEALTAELLRVTAPTPLLPRVAAADGEVAGCPVRVGDRLILVARHAVDAHRRDPSPEDPAPPQVAQLVFGAGTHACPGARLARQQIQDVLAALAKFRPVVVSARVDRHSALPGWSSLIVKPGQ